MGRVRDKDSVAESVRRRVVRSRDRFWHNDDFEGDAKAVDMALSRLAADGELERIRRGVYWRGRKTRFGMSLPSPIAAVRSVLGPGEAVGAAEWYAANLLGLSTQVSPVPVVAVSQRIPTGFDRIRLVDRSSRTGRTRHRLSETDVTVLEAIDGWDRYVELDPTSAVARFTLVLQTDASVQRIVAASSTEPPRVRQRLRWLLEATGDAAAAAKVAPARSAAVRIAALAVVQRDS